MTRYEVDFENLMSVWEFIIDLSNFRRVSSRFGFVCVNMQDERNW